MKELQKTRFPTRLQDPSGTGLRLEGFDPGQTEELWELIQSDQQNPARAHLWPGHEDSSDLRAYLESCRVDKLDAPEFSYLIRTGNGQAVGTFHVHAVSWWNQRVEVGYWLHHAYEGQGWASRALRTIEPCLKKIGFHRVEIRSDPTNRRSCRLAEKNGYQAEAVLRADTWTPLGFRDTAIYAKFL